MDQSFKEKVTPFLREKMEEVRTLFGSQSPEYLALYRQYVPDRREEGLIRANGAACQPTVLSDDGTPVVGFKRIHPNVACLRLTGLCALHCRWCVKASTDDTTLHADQIDRAARFLGAAKNANIHELVINGGDPLNTPAALTHMMEAIAEHAPNIRVVRIHTRQPIADPQSIDWRFLDVGAQVKHLRCEIGLVVNHGIELWPECVDAITRLREHGAVVYNRQVLLKGVNDSACTLIALYDRLREIGVENGVIYHCAPLWGMDHYRTTLSTSMQLLQRLSHRGAFAGRSNPTFVAHTDLGMVVLGPNAIVSDNGHGEVLLQTGYLLEDRLRWEPNFLLPRSVEIDDDGYLRVWYLDGTDVPFDSVQKRSLPTRYQEDAPRSATRNGDEAAPSGAVPDSPASMWTSELV